MDFLHVHDIEFKNFLFLWLHTEIEPIWISFGVDISLENKVILKLNFLLLDFFKDWKKVSTLKSRIKSNLILTLLIYLVFNFRILEILEKVATNITQEG